MADPRPEPSMEDILASIKRIIHDDTAPPKPVAAPAAPQFQPPPEASRPAAPPPRPTFGEPSPAWPRRLDPTPPDSILELTDRVPETFQSRTAAPASAPPPHAPPLQPAELVAPVQRAVDRLRQVETDVSDTAPRPVPRDLLPRTPAPRPSGGDVTLDSLVREMLQPVLADWIERNLPDMVERIVQAEIRRMTEKG